jgi:hypothetical protein
MRYIFLLLFLCGVTVLHAEAPLLKAMKKKSGHVLKVRVEEGLTNAVMAGPVIVVVEEVYRSSSLKPGDRIAVMLQPFAMMADSGMQTKIIPGNELIIFLSKDKPKTYSRSGEQFSYYRLYDDYFGWTFFTEPFAELLRPKKK